MNSYDQSSNPFADSSIATATESSDDFNPFSQDTKTAYEVLPDSATIDVPVKKQINSYSNEVRVSSASVDRDQLALREQLLLKRERQVEVREKDIADKEQKFSSMKPGEAYYNWPFSCWAFAYHDINADIPAPQRPVVTKFYILAIFSWICFLGNWIGILSVWWSGVADADTDALWATVFFFTGIYGSWKLWYLSLYNAIKENSTRKWLWFFFWFFAHFCFVVVMILGIRGFGGCGFFIFVSMFSQEHKFAGVFTLTIFILWCINALVSLLLLKVANSEYKARDSTGRADVVTDTQKEINKVVVDSVADGVRNQAKEESQRILVK